MKVEAIIIDGKKYVPTEGTRCDDCIFDVNSCRIGGYNEGVCNLFDRHAVKEAEDDLNTKHGLEQMPVQVRIDCIYYKTCNGAGCCSKGLPGTICDIKDCVAYIPKPKGK